MRSDVLYAAVSHISEFQAKFWPALLVPDSAMPLEHDTFVGDYLQNRSTAFPYEEQ